MDHDKDRPLEFIETEELLCEVLKRYENAVFIGHASPTDSTTSFYMRQVGEHLTLMGMLRVGSVNIQHDFIDSLKGVE